MFILLKVWRIEGMVLHLSETRKSKRVSGAHHAATLRAVRNADADHVFRDHRTHRVSARLVRQDWHGRLLENTVPAGAHRHAPAAEQCEWMYKWVGAMKAY